jgi:hypothetical protein
MFIIPVAGLAKAAIAVTISLHPAAAHQAPAQYTVKAATPYRASPVTSTAARPPGPRCGG